MFTGKNANMWENIPNDPRHLCNINSINYLKSIKKSEVHLISIFCYFVWVHVKQCIYTEEVSTIKKLHQRILNSFRTVTLEMRQNATQILLRRARYARFIYLFEVGLFFLEGNLNAGIYGEFVDIGLPRLLQKARISN